MKGYKRILLGLLCIPCCVFFASSGIGIVFGMQAMMDFLRCLGLAALIIFCFVSTLFFIVVGAYLLLHSPDSETEKESQK